MSARSAILAKLKASRNLAVEHAVELALREASPEEQSALAEVLLERNRRPGWVAMIRAFHRLSSTIQQKLLSRPRDLFGPLSETSQDLDGPARENVIAIVHQCTDLRLVYLLAEALMDPRADVRILAGNSLLESVRKHWLVTHAPPADQQLPLVESDDTEQLRRAIDFALRHFKTHRQSPALLAALIHERQQDSGMWALFADQYDDRTRAATIILRAPPEPALAAALLLALGSALKPAAIAGLSTTENPALGHALAAESFRLIDPMLREPAQTIHHVKLFPALRKELPWSLANWAAWLRLIDNIGLQAPERLTWLNRMLDVALPLPEACAWKLCLARAIAETGVHDAAVGLLKLARDPDERVARSAARWLLNRRRQEWRERAAAALPSSPHASVRRLVASALAPSDRDAQAAGSTVRGFETAWNSYQRMPPAVQHTTARNVASDPAFAEQLRIKFEGALQEISQALRMIATLPDLTSYRKQIITLCGHSEPRIAAQAVRLVGRLEDPRLKELLEAAANHADARVRASAIESMQELNVANHSQQVLTLINSRNSRERANAIRAIGQFNFATARECLDHMLTDANPLHRMSALWVVGQLNLMDVMRQVSNIARRDPNLRVRKRASEMLETMTSNAVPHS